MPRSYAPCCCAAKNSHGVTDATSLPSQLKSNLKPMKPLVEKQLGSFVRNGLSWLGGLISANGIADASAAQSLESGLTQIFTGLVFWGISAAWSWYRNRKLPATQPTKG